MKEEIEEIKGSYYEYVSKVSDGCQVISDKLRNGDLEVAFSSIVNFAEGLEWLTQVEQLLMKEGYVISSRLSEVNEFMNEINEAIENQDITLVADLFEYEIQPVFISASEWVFIKQ